MIRKKRSRRKKSVNLFTKIIIIDILVGIAAWYASSYLPDSKSHGFMVTGISMIVTTILMQGWEITNLEEHIDNQAIDIVNVLDDDNEMHRMMRTANGAEELIHKTVSSISSIHEDSLDNNFGIFYDYVIDQLRGNLDKMGIFNSSKSMQLEGSDCLRKTALCFQRAKHEVFAISFPSIEFWTDDRTKYYLESNQVAIDNGVNILRIFVLDEINQLDDNGFKDVLRIHFAIHGKGSYAIRVLPRQKIPDFQRQIPDISFFDEKLISRWELRESGTSVDRSVLTFKYEDIVIAKTWKDDLIQRSKPIRAIRDIPNILDDWRGRNQPNQHA